MPAQLSTVKTADGLRLEIAHYKGGPGLPALCIPGLTRNRRDFDALAEWLAGAGRDVYAISLRGRGGSDYDPDYRNYFPTTYRDDILTVMDALHIPRALLIGTSLGGIVAMLTNAAAPRRVAAAVINDVGPELAPEGIARILSYAGVSEGGARTIEEAAAQIRAINEVAFPGRDQAFWREFALNTYRQTAEGWTLDYDMAIGKALKEKGPSPDLWAAFASLRQTPTLVLRGAISDLLTPPIIEKMRAVHTNFTLCEVPNVGHAPTLTEEEAKRAIAAFVAKADQRA